VSTLGFVVKAPAVWGSLAVLVLAVILALVQPAPHLYVLVGLGIVTFVACAAGRLALASYVAKKPAPAAWGMEGEHQRTVFHQGSRAEPAREMVSAQSFHDLLRQVRNLADRSAMTVELLERPDIEPEKLRRELHNQRAQFEHLSKALGRLDDEVRGQEQQRGQ
jgi:hypothetical protein